MVQTFVLTSASVSVIRGGSYNIIFLDEFVYMSSALVEEFFSSVYPTISSGKTTKVMIVSTPHGMNQFYKLWTDVDKLKKMIMFQSKFIGQKQIRS